MGGVQLIRQTDQAPSGGLLFSLTPGPATRTTPALVGGSTSGFAQLSALYELLRGVSLQPRLVMPASVVATLPHQSTVAALPELPGVTEGHESWQALESAGVVIMGLDMKLSSQLQIVLSRLLRIVSPAVICTDELASMFRIEPELLQRPNCIPCFAVATIRRNALGLQIPLRLSEVRGVFGVADLLKSMDATGPLVLSYDADNLYTYIRSSDVMIHTPVSSQDHSRAQRLWLAALLMTYWARGQEGDPVELVRLAHYLVYQLIAQPTNSTRTDAAGVLALFG